MGITASRAIRIKNAISPMITSSSRASIGKIFVAEGYRLIRPALIEDTPIADDLKTRRHHYAALSSTTVPMNDPVQERNEVLYRLDLAVAHLQESMNGQLIPDEGASLGYAVKGARNREDVAAVTGGMVFRGNRVEAGGACAFGADGPCARFILTVMKTNPLIRSAATVTFSENALDVFEAMLLECIPLDQSVKAPPISTMDWGIAASCIDGVPDVIYDDGGNKKPGIMYIFGEEPLVVANNIIICSNRILNIEL